MRRRLAAAAVVVLATMAPIVVGYGFGAAGPARAGEARRILGPGLVTVHVDIHYSQFSPSDLHVYAGTLVRFVVTNRDPIDHEFIVGPPSVHADHEAGHESFHPPVPGEVEVDAGDTGLTTYRFDAPNAVLFACHLPGHFAFGMQGHVTVVAQPA